MPREESATVVDEHHQVVPEYVKLEPPVSTELLHSIARCYQEVFATDSAWDEDKKCPQCPDKHWGREAVLSSNLQICPDCRTTLVDYWPLLEVIATIGENLNRPGVSFIILQTTPPYGPVVGFCWGYPVLVPELEKFLGVEVAEALQKQFGPLYQPDNPIVYQKEIGILPAYQGRGLARGLFQRRLNDFIFRNLRLGVVRTMGPPTPSATYTWYREKLHYATIVEYPDRRVIMAKDLQVLKGAPSS